jgi:hypothetical protein
MKKHLQSTLRTKGGIELKQGTLVSLTFECDDNGHKRVDIIRAVSESGEAVNVPIRHWEMAFGIKRPSLKTLTKYTEEGISRSVFGKRVEPDGFDDEGSPSWLLAEGLI